MTLQHVVLFSFPIELGPTDEADMRRQITTWATAIGGMSVIRFGRPIWTDRTRGYQYLLYMEFPDAMTLRTYQQHPVHQRFLAWINQRNCTPLAFDYELDSATVIHPRPGCATDL